MIFVLKKISSIVFNFPDLLLSLHEATVVINGEITNGSGNLHIIIEDKYDFKHEQYTINNVKRWIINMINNVAWRDQMLGIIDTYDLTIDFNYFVK